MNAFQQTPPTSKDEVRAMRILLYAVVGGAVLLSIIVLALNGMMGSVSPVKEYEKIVLGIALAISLICFIVARNGYNEGIAIAKDSLISLPDKLNQYRSTLIRYLALCEGPAIFGIILFFVTGNYFMFIIPAVMISRNADQSPRPPKADR